MNSKRSRIPLLLLVSVAASFGRVVAIHNSLPTDILPIHYEIGIILKDSALSDTGTEFEGIVYIKLQATKETSQIKLHVAHDYLKLNEITVGEAVIPESDYSVDSKTDILTIKMSQVLNENDTTFLVVKYTGIFANDMRGLFKFSYTDDEGLKKFAVATLFEPVYARRAFPCFDEPNFKADIQLSVTYPEGYSVLSNENVKTNSKPRTVNFEKSSAMSTYQIGFLVSNFTCTQIEIGDEPFRVCSRRETENLRRFALDIGPKLLKSIKKYMQHDYYITKHKLDLVALPEYGTKATENLGLLMCREEQLLWEKEDGVEAQKEVVLSMAHKFINFWFGYSVTTPWWSDAFINEGIATYLSYLTANDVLSDWRLEDQFVIDVVQEALEMDGRIVTYPIYSEGKTIYDVDGFGDLVKLKGAALIHMVKNIIRADRFQEGLRNYLKKHAHGIASADDLWDALDEAVDNKIAKLPASLKEIMHNWLFKPGFPVVTISLEGPNAVLTQERYMESGNDYTKWYIPICFATAVAHISAQSTCNGPDYWLTPKDNKVTYDFSPFIPETVRINNQLGYYRVKYDKTAWRPDPYLELKGVSEVNLGQICDDSFSLAGIGKLPYQDVTCHFKVNNHTPYFMWAPAMIAHGRFIKRFQVYADDCDSSDCLDDTNSYQLELWGWTERLIMFALMDLTEDRRAFHDIFDILGTYSGNYDETKHFVALGLAVGARESCGIHSFMCWLLLYPRPFVMYDEIDDDQIIPSRLINSRGAILCLSIAEPTIIKDQSFITWPELLQQYTEHPVSVSRKKEMLRALGCTRDADLQEKYIKMSISEIKNIKAHHRSMMFQAISYFGFDVALKFLEKNIESIEQVYPVNIYPKLLMDLAEATINQTRFKKLKTYIDSGKVPKRYKRAATDALTVARYNSQWLPKYEKQLPNWENLAEKRRRNLKSAAFTYKLTSHVYVIHLLLLYKIILSI